MIKIGTIRIGNIVSFSLRVYRYVTLMFSKVLSDVYSIVDRIEKLVGKSLSESIFLNDILFAVLTRSKLLTDALSMVDNIFVSISKLLNLNEILVMTDYLSVSKTATHIISASLQKVVATISLSNATVHFLGGIITKETANIYISKYSTTYKGGITHKETAEINITP